VESFSVVVRPSNHQSVSLLVRPRRRQTRAFHARNQITVLASSDGGDDNIGPSDKDNSFATNTTTGSARSTGGDCNMNHHDHNSHSTGLQHLKDLLTNEREERKRDVDGARREGEQRISASEKAYSEVIQANDLKSQAAIKANSDLTDARIQVFADGFTQR
jgi:hypothetical protein